MAVLNLLLVFLVFAGVHRLETALYSRCQERVAYDGAQVAAWRTEMTEARAQAQLEKANPFIDDSLRASRVASLARRAAAAQAVVDAQVQSSCNRLRLLGLGR